MNDYIGLINQANKNLGLINQEITSDTIGTITALSEGQQKALFNEMLLIAEQRGHENILNPEKNPFRAFIIDAGEFGWSIQDYMLEVLEGIEPQWVNDDTYTDAQQAENLVKDYEQDIEGAIHYEPFRKQFPTTIRDYEYKKSFYPSKIGAFVDRKISMLSTSAEIYLMKSVLIDEVLDMAVRKDLVVKKGYNVNSSNGILTLLESVKSDYEGFSQPNNSYNADGVISITPYDELKFMITKASIYERIKVREYSGAYNLEQMKLDGRILFIPEDVEMPTIDGESILFFLVDRRALVIALKMWKMGTFYVPNQYKTNHWLGVEGIRGHNRFINAVAYTGADFGDFT